MAAMLSPFVSLPAFFLVDFLTPFLPVADFTLTILEPFGTPPFVFFAGA
jgi:hypothetical protein